MRGRERSRVRELGRETARGRERGVGRERSGELTSSDTFRQLQLTQLHKQTSCSQSCSSSTSTCHFIARVLIIELTTIQMWKFGCVSGTETADAERRKGDRR